MERATRARTVTAVALACVIAFATGCSSGGKSDKKKSASAESTVAEAPIPTSVASGRVNPAGLDKAGGHVVKPSAKEVDAASDLNFAADSDPYCKDQSHLANLLKDTGYNIDKELRGAESFPDADEEKVGDELFAEVEKAKEFKGKLDTPAMASYRKYVAEIAVPLLAQVKRKGIAYDFHTIDDDVVNAFAIPGGHIFVYRGILEKPKRIENEAQLVGVIGHEINHVDRRHTIAVFEYLKKLGGLSGGAADIGQIILSMARHPFTSKQEDEADEFAVKFMMAAEYSPKQFVSMWQNWDALDKDKGGKNPLTDEFEEILRTHPRSSRRACHAMRVTMANKDASVERYYVGTTNFKEKKPRAAEQY